tara:strand:+ start:691 stop:1332 length:642 start_codon:yes stop_codon:yes gene_type:complete
LYLVNKKPSSGPTKVILTKNSHPSFVGSWVLEDLSICDRLIDYIDSKSAIISGVTDAGTVYQGGKKQVVKGVKDSTDRSLDFKYQVCVDYSTMLQKCLDMYLREFKFANQVSKFTDGIDTGNVQKYPKGGGYHQWHAERGCMHNANRHLVYMTYLNDVSDGGETEFFYQKLKVKPKKGLTLIWPVDWTHTHRGVPSMTEEKYIATGWYTFTGE